MKQLFFLLAIILFSTTSWAQSPHMGEMPASLDSLQKAILGGFELDGLKEQMQELEFSKIDEDGKYTFKEFEFTDIESLFQQFQEQLGNSAAPDSQELKNEKRKVYNM